MTSIAERLASLQTTNAPVNAASGPVVLTRLNGDAPAPKPANDLDRIEMVESMGKAITASVGQVLAGRTHAVELATACLLAGGHLLIEDIPGVGKTLLAQALAQSIGGSFHRIQGTPDLLPGDVTGAMLPFGDPGSDTVRFRFRPGPIFANVVLFDEVNRTNQRTQSALLESAGEGAVTIDTATRPLPNPFLLIATQNPIEFAGTYPLGEGAIDRFSAVLTPGRAGRDEEVEVLTGRRGRNRLGAVQPVIAISDLVAAREIVGKVHVADALASYVVDLLEATRTHPSIRLGASTRGGVALIALARAKAAMAGRRYVVPADIGSVASAVLAHRVIVADRAGSTAAGRRVVESCLEQVPVPAV